MREFKTFAENPTDPYNQSIDDDNYILKKDWDYIWKEDGVYWKFHCKKGIIYDSASVPSLLGGIIDIHPNGVLRPAALPHDLLFIWKGKNLPEGMIQRWNGLKWINVKREWTLKETDKLFRRINKEADKMPKWKQWVVYRTLRLGSWLPWRSDDIEDQQQIGKLYK